MSKYFKFGLFRQSQIIKIIKSENLFEVEIPCANDIEMGDKRNRRYAPMFDDTIRGFAVFRYKQRVINEKDQLVAKIKDYDDAEKFFNEYELIQSPDSFNKTEIHIGNTLNDLNTALTIEEIADKCGISPNTAKKYLNSLELKLDGTDVFHKFPTPNKNPGKGGRPKEKYKIAHFDKIELSGNKINMGTIKRKEWLWNEVE